MKKQIKITMLAFVCVVAGVLSGGIGATVIVGGLTRDALILLKLGELIESSARAFDAYSEEEAEFGIWTLKQHVATIDRLWDSGIPKQHPLYPEQKFLHDRWLSHARLAKPLLGSHQAVVEVASHAGLRAVAASARGGQGALIADAVGASRGAKARGSGSGRATMPLPVDP